MTEDAYMEINSGPEALFLYSCTDHAGHWPVGVASVVVAGCEHEARNLLDAALKELGLKGHAEKPYTLTEIDLTNRAAHVLRDGDY